MVQERKGTVAERPVYLHELDQLPQEISGVLAVATFTDFSVREMNTEVVVIDPEIVDADGQKIDLDTHRDRRWFPHPAEYFAEQNRAIRMARRHVR